MRLPEHPKRLSPIQSVIGRESGTKTGEPVPRIARDGFMRKSGGDLLSQDVSVQVPSALVGLTAVFGMGTGVTPPL